MIVGLARLARSCGVTICERTEVIGIRRDADGLVVETNGGAARAQDVLLTTGGYTRGFDRFLWARTLGLPSIAAASEALPAEAVSDIFRSGRVLLINRFRAFMCRPSPDGRRIILGGPVGQTPGDTQDNVRSLRGYFTKIFPGLRGIGFSHCWTGLIAATRDAQAHSGAHEGIWYSVGASGLVSCADAGRRMAQRILNADVGGSGHFPRWPLRDSERLLWRGVEWSSRLLDRVGRSRLR
jgi:glycine/D-amino acid oxidase-like deaminating enzyme